MTQLEIRMRTGITLKTIQNYLKMTTEDIPPEKKIQSARKHEEATENKRKAVEEVRSLFEKGLPVSRISEITGHTPATIKRYLDQKFNPKDPCYDNFFPGKLGPYRQKVLELREKNWTYAKIHAYLQEQGYTGTVDVIRGFMAKQRRIHQDVKERYLGKTIDVIERKWLIQSLFYTISKVPVLDDERLILLKKEYSIYAFVYQLVWTFRDLFKMKKML